MPSNGSSNKNTSRHKRPFKREFSHRFGSPQKLDAGTEAVIYKLQLTDGQEVPRRLKDVVRKEPPNFLVLRVPFNQDERQMQEEAAYLSNAGRGGMIVEVQLSENGPYKLGVIDKLYGMAYQNEAGETAYVSGDPHAIIPKLCEGQLGSKIGGAQEAYSKNTGLVLGQMMNKMHGALGHFYESNPGVVHRDIKLKNFLLDEATYDDQGNFISVELVLCDFGCASKIGKAHNQGGTAEFLSIESIKADRNDATYARDMFAKRVTFMELIGRSIPDLMPEHWAHTKDKLDPPRNEMQKIVEMAQSGLSSSECLEKYYQNLKHRIPPDNVEARIMLASLKDYLSHLPMSDPTAANTDVSMLKSDKQAFKQGMEKYAKNLINYYLMRDGKLASVEIEQIKNILPPESSFDHVYNEAIKNIREQFGITSDSQGILAAIEPMGLDVHNRNMSQFIKVIDENLGYEPNKYQPPEDINKMMSQKALAAEQEREARKALEAANEVKSPDDDAETIKLQGLLERFRAVEQVAIDTLKAKPPKNTINAINNYKNILGETIGEIDMYLIMKDDGDSFEYENNFEKFKALNKKDFFKDLPAELKTEHEKILASLSEPAVSINPLETLNKMCLDLETLLSNYMKDKTVKSDKSSIFQLRQNVTRALGTIQACLDDDGSSFDSSKIQKVLCDISNSKNLPNEIKTKCTEAQTILFQISKDPSPVVDHNVSTSEQIAYRK